MTAARFRLSGDARRRWRSWLALALLAGLAAGVVMASLAAAQRADSAFGRFRQWSIAANIQLDAGPDALSEFEDFGVQTAEPPIGIADLARIDDLSGLLVLVAAATLSNTLIMTLRQRRRDLAILKRLGFERRQVWTTVAWHASALVLAALVVAVPSGIAGGRWLWTLFADDLGIVPAPVVPLVAVVVLLLAGLVVTNLIAVLPGGSAAATHPALVPRGE